MKYLRVFENWVNEGLTVAQLADAIQKAVGGLGTDEEALLAAILQIKNPETIIKVNQVFKANSEYSYQSIGQAIEGELGFLDQSIKDQIYSHIKKIRGEAYLEKWTGPPIKIDLIKQILPRIIQHEGKKDRVYLDTKGIPTIGVGFNLNRSDSSAKLKAVGANPVKIKAGKAKLTDSQINTLLTADLERSKLDAQALIRNWQKTPPKVQGVLVEMVFNLGKRGLSEFKNFLNHIENRRYQAASKEMLNSTWARQVGNRATTLSNIVKSAQ